MTEEIRKAVIGAIAAEFSLPVYGQSVPQGGKKPCFTVELQELEQKRLLGRRAERKQRFAVRYFCKEEKTAAAEAGKVAEQLYGALELIGEGEAFAAGGMKLEKTADGLEMTVDYTYHVLFREEKAEPMLRMEYNGKGMVGYGKTDIQQGTAE